MQVPTNFFDSFKFWLRWKEESVKSLKRGWTIDDAIALVAFFEYTIVTGLCTPREADKQLRKVLKPTRLTLISMTKYAQAQVLLSEGRDSRLKAFLMFDGLVSYLERHYHPDTEEVFEKFTSLIPYLSDYPEELCSWCEYAGRAYLLPSELWGQYESPIPNFSLSRPIIRWVKNRQPNLHPQTIGLIDLFRADAQAALTRNQRTFKGRHSKTKHDDKLLELSCPEEDLLSVIKLIEVALMECCSRLTIIDTFAILDGLLMIAEERWLMDIEQVCNTFSHARDQLLEGFTFAELQDYLETFDRPYRLIDG